MALRFSLYYFSQSTGEYLQEVVNTSQSGSVTHSSLISASLPEQVNNDTDVYFVEFDEKVAGLDQWIENLQHHLEHPAIYLYLREARTEILLKALRLGVQECFVRQISEEEFQKALVRLKKFQANPLGGEKTKTIGVFGCKGGAGATFVAVNLAQSLVSRRQESVLLFDLDLRAGNVTSFLDVQTKYTILDVIENFDRIDPQYLQAIVHKCESGLNVLPAPARMEDSELVQAQHIDQVLHYIQGLNLYRWILLDLGDNLDEVALKALERCEVVLLITLLNIPGLRDAKKILEVFQLLEFGEDKVNLVVNCYSRDVDIKVAEAKKFLGFDFLGMLRFDHAAAVRSINEGHPLVETQPDHRLSGDFFKLVEELQPNIGDNGHAQSRWSSLKRILRLKG